MSRVWTDEECAWLRERWPLHTDSASALDEFEARFGRRPTVLSVRMKADALGIRKQKDRTGRKSPEAAQQAIRWSRPEFAHMKAWMLEHDTAGVPVTIADFEAEFGIRLTRGQVQQFRAYHGGRRMREKRGGRVPKPLGSELERKDGYIYVKVREEPRRPGTRDNWEPKHHVVWREANGADEVPEGMCVYFADRDIRNFDPANLVLVPRSMIARLNSPDTPDYWDADSLRAALAVCELHSAVKDKEAAMPRRCAVCGRLFVEDERQRRCPSRAQTCRACLDAGKKARGEQRSTEGPRECAVCGRVFTGKTKAQRRCPECIAENPRGNVDKQRRRRERENA